MFQSARLVVEDGRTAWVVVDPPKTKQPPDGAPIVLVPSSELQVHRLAPGLFQIVSKAQGHPFWRVNALGSKIWSVGTGIVGTDGGGCDGNYIRKPSWMEVVLPSPEDARAGNFQVRIPDLELVFRPRPRTLLIEGGGGVGGSGTRLSTQKTWESAQISDFLFHLRIKDQWEDQYLAVDAGGRAVRLVRPGRTFGKKGETGQVLRTPVQSIRTGGRYSGSDVPRLLEPAEGAVMDNGSSRESWDELVWKFRWTPVDGAEYYYLEVYGYGGMRVRQASHVLVSGGQSYGRSRQRKITGTWRVRAYREGKPLPWSEKRAWSDIEEFNTDRGTTLIDYLVDDTGKGKKRGRRAPTLKKPKAGAVLDNGRADGLDSLSWTFEWGSVRGHREYELILVRGHDQAPFLRERVQGTRFEFNSDEYRVFGGPRRGWCWRVRTLDGHEPGRWSEMRRFDVEPLDTDPPRQAEGADRPNTSKDVPALLKPKAGSCLRHNEFRKNKSGKDVIWTFKWKAVPGADAYDFEYGSRATRWRPKLEKRVKGTTFKEVGGPTGWKYGGCDWYWRVRALRDGKTLPWSERRPFDVGWCLKP